MVRRHRSHLFLLAAGLASTSVLSSLSTARAAPETTRDTRSRPGPVQAIIADMHDAHARLKRGDTGEETRSVQERVVRELQQLVDEAKRRSNHGAASPNAPTSERAARRNAPAPDQKRDSGAAPQPDFSSGPASKASAGKLPAGAPNRAPANANLPLLRDFWGHLPPAVRERIPADFGEMILPAYDDLVRRYFEALLDDRPTEVRDLVPPARDDSAPVR